MEVITEHAGAMTLGLIIFVLIAYTIRGQFKNKGSCGCGNSSCPKSTSCAISQNIPCENMEDKNS